MTGRRVALGLLLAVALAGLTATATNRLRYSPLLPGAVVDKLVLEKGARTLTLFHEGRVLKSYRVSLGRQPVGAKQFEGDGKTPEGSFRIDYHKSDSAYHLALHVSYPTPADVAFAREQGRSPGGAIMIHGLPNGLGFLGPLHRVLDWTDGCIALTDAEIEDLWDAVPDGTPIEIRP